MEHLAIPDDLVRRYQDGELGTSDLSRLLGRSSQRVRVALHRRGVPLCGVRNRRAAYARRVEQDDVQERLRVAVDDLDQTIKEIRGTIFELSREPGTTDLRSQLRDVVAAARASSGLSPQLEIVGPLAVQFGLKVAGETLPEEDEAPVARSRAA